jgi:hypothetical protein
MARGIERKEEISESFENKFRESSLFDHQLPLKFRMKR